MGIIKLEYMCVWIHIYEYIYVYYTCTIEYIPSKYGLPLSLIILFICMHLDHIIKDYL